MRKETAIRHPSKYDLSGLQAYVWGVAAAVASLHTSQCCRVAQHHNNIVARVWGRQPCSQTRIPGTNNSTSPHQQ
jgi:hypothetical protein